MCIRDRRKRVGPMTNFERLVLEIWTDGTISPTDSLTHSAEILRHHFQQVADFGKQAIVTDGKVTTGASLPAHIYEMPIEKLDLTPRAYNSLKRANISKVGEVLEMSEEELLSVRNFGKKSLDELRDRLGVHGLLTEASNSTLLQSSSSQDAFVETEEFDEDEEL